MTIKDKSDKVGEDLKKIAEDIEVDLYVFELINRIVKVILKNKKKI